MWRHKVSFLSGAGLTDAEKVIYFVIPNEVRNLSLVLTREKRDSSVRSAPRNDKNMSFFASCFSL
jgi:hypothetical protein